jgi:hypothetical protein
LIEPVSEEEVTKELEAGKSKPKTKTKKKPADNGQLSLIDMLPGS